MFSQKWKQLGRTWNTHTTETPADCETVNTSTDQKDILSLMAPNKNVKTEKKRKKEMSKFTSLFNGRTRIWT